MNLNKKPLKLLIIEDNLEDAELLLSTLRRAGFAPDWKRVETAPAFLDEIAKAPDIILSDYAMPYFSGLEAVTLLQQSGRDIPFILVSGTIGEDVAVEAMKMGASDYLLKDRTARLGNAVERALEQKQLRAERKRVELSLNLFRTLVDRSSDGIDVVDPETGRFLDVNQTTCERLGYTRDELLAMNVADIEIPGVAFGSWDQFMAELRQTGSKIMEGLQKRKDGSTLPVEVRVRYVKLDREYLIASVRDITERKRGEAELLEWKNRYEAAINSSGQILYDWNPVTNALAYGGDVQRILGYTMAEMEGGLAHWMKMIHPDDVAAFQAEVNRVLRTPDVFRLQYRMRRKDGTFIHTEDVGHFFLNATGQIVRMVGFVNDITGRKRVEAEIQNQLQELQRWHEAMLGREDRILELKREVNEQLSRQHLPPRYQSTLNHESSPARE